RIIDSLPELGGQLTALYPEKYVYDVGGFPRILARDLAKNLIEQGMQHGAEVRLEEEVLDLERGEGMWTVVTDKARYPTKTVLIAGGKGAFSPRVLDCPGYERLLGRGVAYHVRDPAHYDGLRVLIVGGGDSAVDWALSLGARTRRLVLIHRRQGFRAHAQSMRLLHEAVERGDIELLTHREVKDIHGEDRVASAVIFDNRTGEETTLELDAVLTLIGFKPDLGPIATWGLELEKNTIRVSPRFETTLPGVFAAGDIAHYEGKLELIATAFGEATMAVNHAVQVIDPGARYSPGHSSNLKMFKEREAQEEAEAG
ncbi:MAG: NAD(P)/FAD-dependent oxidoreductase, partial [Gemmatimonadota bacterium]